MTSVLHLIASSRGGGASHVRDLARGLERERFSVRVAMPAEGPPRRARGTGGPVAALRALREDVGNVGREDLPSGIAFYPVDFAAGFSLQALGQIRRLAREADILHVHGARAALFGRLAAISLGQRRPHTVYTIHGFAAPHYSPPKREVLLGIERVLATVTERWICVSGAERAALLSSGVADTGRVQVIRNGIDADQFALAAGERRHTRESLDIPSDAYVITTVCRLHRPRDFGTLLQAFQRVRAALPHTLLLMVGEGPLRAEIEGRIWDLGLQEQVRLLGVRRDVPQLLGATDVFVLSSRGWEGLPLSVLEAMAAALPVVASDVGGTGEAVADGHTGYLYPPGDAGALAQHIQALASDPTLARDMGQRGLSRVRQFFTAVRMVQETASLYEELLAQGLTDSSI